MNARDESSLSIHEQVLRAKHRQGLPDSLRQAGPVKQPFEQARDPLIRAQLADLTKTESQRRGETAGRGSTMVKLHKPFPELKPKHVQGPLHKAFNQAWLREQRAAMLAQLETKRRRQDHDRHIEHDQTAGHER